MKKYTLGFTLVELLVSITIISFVIVAAIQVLSDTGVAKIKLIEKTRIEKEAFFSVEKFVELIKKWGTIDYEEYWNRYNYDTQYLSGHFVAMSGFWNFWNTWIPGNISVPQWYWWRTYDCISNPAWGWSMWTGGCLNWKNISFNLSTLNINYWSPTLNPKLQQRYTQYQLQFIDRNSNNDVDYYLWNILYGDEDGDGSILYDDDDLHIGMGPAAFPNGIDVWELYLINISGNERTYFRWNVWLDPDRPPGATCTGTKIMTWSGCLWNIEILKLVGKDYWFWHTLAIANPDGSQWDGIIDTWVIHPDFVNNGSEIIAWSNTTSYWQPIFPNTIHVSELAFYLYPNKSVSYSWADTSPNLQIAPYLQLRMVLEPSWKERRKIKWPSPRVEINTTLQLSSLDIY